MTFDDRMDFFRSKSNKRLIRIQKYGIFIWLDAIHRFTRFVSFGKAHPRSQNSRIIFYFTNRQKSRKEINDRAKIEINRTDSKTRNVKVYIQRIDTRNTDFWFRCSLKNIRKSYYYLGRFALFAFYFRNSTWKNSVLFSIEMRTQCMSSWCFSSRSLNFK